MEYLDIMYDLLPGKINWTNNNLMDMIHEIRVQKLATGKKWETNAVSNFFLLCEMHFCDVFAHDKTTGCLILKCNFLEASCNQTIRHIDLQLWFLYSQLHDILISILAFNENFSKDCQLIKKSWKIFLKNFLNFFFLKLVF